MSVSHAVRPNHGVAGARRGCNACAQPALLGSHRRRRCQESNMDSLPATTPSPEHLRTTVFVERAPRSEPPLLGTALHRRSPHASPSLRVRRSGPHSGRSGRPVDPTTALNDRDRLDRIVADDAREFADRTLRAVLEVIDRRRNPARLGASVSPSVTGMAGALASSAVPGRHLGVAVLVRVQVALTGADTAEVFGSYSRGNRYFAVAARVHHRRRPGGVHTWTLTSLRLS